MASFTGIRSRQKSWGRFRQIQCRRCRWRQAIANSTIQRPPQFAASLVSDGTCDVASGPSRTSCSVHFCAAVEGKVDIADLPPCRRAFLSRQNRPTVRKQRPRRPPQRGRYLPPAWRHWELASQRSGRFVHTGRVPRPSAAAQRFYNQTAAAIRMTAPTTRTIMSIVSQRGTRFAFTAWILRNRHSTTDQSETL